MPRGMRDVERTRRILRKILNGIPYKQIAFEEKTTVPYIAAIKSKYIDETVDLQLNGLGLFVMNEEQLTLPLQRHSLHRVDHRLQNPRSRSKHRQRPRKLV
jgi:hypothetical protein